MSQLTSVGRGRIGGARGVKRDRDETGREGRRRPVEAPANDGGASISTLGYALLGVWARAPVPMDPDRSRFMLKVYSLWLAEPPAAAHLLREHERLHAERLATYEAIEAEMRRSGAAEEPVTSPRFAAYATLRRGIGYEREYVAWCRWLAERFEAAAGG